ncbi:fumarylacetoacetate hydrolase family protein [Streptomyces adelaidensis]|jgi:2-keto-4-pentenoate hydratase/2-oxohepta-3-ene-1,7-dioic acid hydratase in catechol pathway|uniref:fumarylacetoacetate hydrolase family protein n=1 Tax=Streptomyces adelaidensis TaxID=2796465 RepID=UPI001908E339|nr:fumarylacetoacetate hydrolase family protein [Streptomyces adelaidensis]
MRLVTYRHNGRTGFGRLTGDGDAVIECGPLVNPGLGSIRDVLAEGALDHVRDVTEGRTGEVKLADVQLLPPVPDPAKILCAGVNYRTHREETARPQNAFPTIFPRYADSQVGHDQPLVRPAETEAFDYEGELAVVMGRGGRRIPAEDAFAYIAGYSCYQDGSVRDWQRHSGQWITGKTFPATGGFGPALVTADEVPDVSVLQLVSRVNGEVRQSAGVGDLLFSIPELIAYVSTFTPLAPGDVIVTGTPGGVGLFREPPVFLQPGDVLEVEISGIGTLRNPVVKEV